MRSDRNLYSKNLIESQDEITEMKRKLKIMNHQIDQLKEEIMAKEAALVKEHLEHQRVEKEKDALKAELQRMKQQAAESKAYIEQQEVEERKLLKIISEADAERLRQKKELDQVGSYSLLTPCTFSPFACGSRVTSATGELARRLFLVWPCTLYVLTPVTFFR